MLFLSLLAFGCLSGVLGSNKLCELMAHKACLGETKESYIPKTKEDLDHICTDVQKLKQCVDDDVITCSLPNQQISPTDITWLFKRQAYTNVYLVLCQNNSDIYSKLLSSLPCVANVSSTEFREDSCQLTAEMSLAPLEKRLKRLLKDETDFDTHLYKGCLWDLMFKNCFINLNYRKCGSDARDVAFVIMKNLSDLDETCPMDIRIDILELLNDLNLLTRQEISVKEYLKNDDLF